MGKSVARGSLLGVLGQAWHLLAAFALYAYLARRLGPELFGRWKVVLSLLAWFEIFTVSGIMKVATKSISESPDETSPLARAAYAGQLAVSLAVFALAEAGAGALAGALGDPALAPLIRIAALDIPLYGLFMAASGIMLGRRRYERQGIAWLVYATAKAVLIALLVSAGLSVTGALVANALSSVVGFAALAWSPRGRLPRRAELAPVLRRMALASVPFLAIGLLDGLHQNADLWLVSAMSPQRDIVGLYAAAAVLAQTPVFLFLGVNRVILPSASGARAEGDAPRADKYATTAVRAALAVTILGVALAASVGRQAIEVVFSPAYGAALVPLVLLMTAASGRTVQAVSVEVLMAAGRHREAIGVLGAAVVAEVALVAALGIRWGITGASAGAAVAAVATAAACAFVLRDPIGAGMATTLGRCAVAAAVVGTALAALEPAPILLLPLLPLALAAYVALLALLGELDLADVATMRRAVGW